MSIVMTVPAANQAAGFLKGLDVVLGKARVVCR